MPFVLGDPSPAPERVVVVAVYAFTARDPEDLSLVKGEQYIVLDDSSQDQWWQVKNSTMDVGFIPSNYVKKLAPVGTRLEEKGWDEGATQRYS